MEKTRKQAITAGNPTVLQSQKLEEVTPYVVFLIRDYLSTNHKINN